LNQKEKKSDQGHDYMELASKDDSEKIEWEDHCRNRNRNNPRNEMV
jgi:hypothetical protein